MTGFKPLTLRH